jgi:hypothetical protein
MNQIIFIKILHNHQNNFNFMSEIEKLSYIYRFNIKKFISHMNGALIEININNINQLQKNTKVSIIYEEYFSYTNELQKYLKNKK